MRHLLMKFLGLSLLLAGLAGCATTTLVNSWESPERPAGPFKKPLVVAMAVRDEVRGQFDSILVADLKYRGVPAILGTRLLPRDGHPDRAALEAAVRESGADSIIVLNIFPVSGATEVSSGSTITYEMGWSPWAYPGWNFYGYYSAVTVYTPPSATTEQLWQIRASLFRADDGKLLWTATFEATDLSRILKASKEVAGKVSGRLATAGLI